MIAGTPEALYNIILELENVLFKLKDYARAVQAANSRGTKLFVLILGILVSRCFKNCVGVPDDVFRRRNGH